MYVLDTPHCTPFLQQVSWVHEAMNKAHVLGIAGSITTFSSWMLEGYLAFSNSGQYNRKGLHDVRVSLGQNSID